MDSENIILVDWFAFTLHNDFSIDQVKDFLGLLSACKWLEISGHYGYKQALYSGGIWIMWDGYTDDMGICVEMSGQGCRQFETSSCKSFAQLFEEVCADEEQFHVTRLDVAYDKSQERGGLDYHWVRCELQLRRDRALAFLKLKETWGERFFGVLNNYLRFIVPSKTDSNRRRAPSPVWWDKFMQSVGKITLYTPKGVEYNLTKLERYLFTQCGNSIDTYIQCKGELKFREMLKHRDSFLNANQQALVDEYKQINEEKLKEYWKKHPWG